MDVSSRLRTISLVCLSIALLYADDLDVFLGANQSEDLDWNSRNPWLYNQCKMYVETYEKEPNQTVANTTTQTSVQNATVNGATYEVNGTGTTEATRTEEVATTTTSTVGSSSAQTSTSTASSTTSTLPTTTSSTSTRSTSTVSTSTVCTEWKEYVQYDHILEDKCVELNSTTASLSADDCKTFCIGTPGCLSVVWSSERSPRCRAYGFKPRVQGICKKEFQLDNSLYEIKTDCRNYYCNQFNEIKTVGGQRRRWTLNSFCNPLPPDQMSTLAHGSISTCKEECAKIGWCKGFEYKSGACIPFTRVPQDPNDYWSADKCAYMRGKRVKLFLKDNEHYTCRWPREW